MIDIHIRFRADTLFFKTGKCDRAGFVCGVAAAKMGLKLGDQFSLVFNGRELDPDEPMVGYHGVEVEMVATGGVV
jgi:hypothetical protein